MSIPARQTLRLVIAAIIIWLCWLAAPKSHGSQDNPTRAELLQTVKHISQLAQETQAELDAEKQAHAQTEASLENSIKSNHDAQMQYAAYQLACETEIQKGNSAIVSLAALVKKHHLDLIILCGLWVGFVALLYLKAGSMLGPIGIYAGGALAAAGIAFILMKL